MLEAPSSRLPAWVPAQTTYHVRLVVCATVVMAVRLFPAERRPVRRMAVVLTPPASAHARSLSVTPPAEMGVRVHAY